MDTALHMAEIRHAIGEYLNITDLKQCICVNQSWHDSFVPLRWKSLDLEMWGSEPLVSSLEKHHAHIRQLRLGYRVRGRYVAWLSKETEKRVNGEGGEDELRDGDIEASRHERENGQDGNSCSSSDNSNNNSNNSKGVPFMPRLQDLTFENFCSQGIQAYDPSLAAKFVRLHAQTLRSFTYEPNDREDHDEGIWDALSTCLELELLELIEAEVSEDLWEPFWKVCRITKRLTLRLIDFSKWTLPSGQDEDLLGRVMNTRARIQSFRIVGCSQWDQDRLLWMLKQCPDLFSLTFGDPEMDVPSLFPWKAFTAELVQGTWLHLVRLIIHHGPGFKDQQVSDLLKAIRPLEALGLRDFGFDHESFQVLRRRHFRTLQELDLEGCLGLSSEMVRMVLEECTGLRCLSVREMTAQDILLIPQPWKNKGLKSLKMGVVMTRFEDPQQNQQENRQVLERLSGFSKMECLHIRRPNQRVQGRVDNPTLELSLEKGLDLLGSWQKLKWIGLWRRCDVTEKEFDWMLRHWPRIETLECNVLVRDLALEEMSLRILGRKVEVLRR